MVTLTSLKDLLTQHKILIILASIFLITLLIVAAIFTRSRQVPFGKLPKPEVDQGLVVPGEKPAVTSKFSTSDLEAQPRQGRVFKLKPFPNEREIVSTASQLAGTATAVKNPEGELVFVGQKNIVFYNQQTGALRLNLKTLSKPPSDRRLSEAELTDKIKQFLVDFGFYKTVKGVVVVNKKYSASFGFEFKSVSDFSKAEFLDLAITKNVEGVEGAQVIAQNATLSPTFVKISVFGEIVILEHYFTEETEGALYKFKTQGEISKSLAAGGEFFVLQITEGDKDPIEIISPYKLGTVEAAKISLAYFREKSNLGLLQPVFKIEGVAKTVDEKSVDVVLIIPVVSSELISP